MHRVPPTAEPADGAPAPWEDMSILDVQNRMLGLRSRNESLWPRGCRERSIGRADLHIHGFDYFAETLPAGGYRLTRIGL